MATVAQVARATEGVSSRQLICVAPACISVARLVSMLLAGLPWQRPLLGSLGAPRVDDVGLLETAPVLVQEAHGHNVIVLRVPDKRCSSRTPFDASQPRREGPGSELRTRCPGVHNFTCTPMSSSVLASSNSRGPLTNLSFSGGCEGHATEDTLCGRVRRPSAVAGYALGARTARHYNHETHGGVRGVPDVCRIRRSPRPPRTAACS